MFSEPLQFLQWLWGLNPYQQLRQRQLNFITIHLVGIRIWEDISSKASSTWKALVLAHLYILSMGIITSILLFPVGNLEYIDALFFASGCATQSGLNTVNINDLTTYQQIVMYMMTMFCTPIFIHSSVVFVRLYWFERRFQNIVQESRNKSRSRQKTFTKADMEPDLGEKGVRGRKIVVMHRNAPSEVQEIVQDEPEIAPAEAEEPVAHIQRNITFADEITKPRSASQSLTPLQFSLDQHIAIREKQRDVTDRSTLRIPGPRDFDQGREPEPLEMPLDQPDSQDTPVAVESEKRSPFHFDLGHLHRPRTDLSAISMLTRRRHDMENAPTQESHPAPRRSGTFGSFRAAATTEREPVAPYLSWQPTIGRNSAFADLNQQQREELGGIEYRSLKTLAIVLVSYFVVFHLLGVIVLLPWIIRTPPWNNIVQSESINKAWWGIFTSASLFNDLGFTLNPDSFQSFQLAVVPLLFGSFLIIVGNTGFPCMLRLVIWVLSKLARTGTGVWEELRFLLDHPRRCFTLLFPASATWWLFWILAGLNGLDIIFFIVLDIHDETISSINPAGYRVLNGLFQAASTRTAGFASVNLANLHPGIQVSYLIMMYISVFPIAISMRRTNVYEEKSLGIYQSANQESEDEKEPSYVGAHLRRQLSFDLWYIFTGFFIIAIAEGRHIENTNEYAFTLFSVLFEIVSAYGTVGLSLGYPKFDTSFSGQFSVVSKLVIIAMQIRGRHRGLPYQLDRAVLLPSDRMHHKEDVDAAKRLKSRNSTIPMNGSPQHTSPPPDQHETPHTRSTES